MEKPFRPVKTAVIGCGMISDIYLKNMVEVFQVLHVVGCSDLVEERARAKAEKYGIRQMTNEEIFSDPEIELVVNLTYPTAHFAVSKAALLAGKNVHSEKMFAITLEQARELRDIAREKGLQLTAAPDTWLGGRLQTARQILDGGLIGTPLAADIVLDRCYRHSEWKTESEKRFAFCPGGGFLNDMGGYYLTALVSMLGSIRRVTGFYRTFEPARPFRHPGNPAYGEMLTYDNAPNCYAAALQFENGVLCSLNMTSEVRGGGSIFNLHGTQGTLYLDDPNNFGGPLMLELSDRGGKKEMPLSHAYTENSRGLGAADAAYALRNGRKPRCDTDLIFHVYEAAKGIEISCDSGKIYEMGSRCDRPAPFAPGHMEYPEMVMDL